MAAGNAHPSVANSAPAILEGGAHHQHQFRLQAPRIRALVELIEPRATSQPAYAQLLTVRIVIHARIFSFHCRPHFCYFLDVMIYISLISLSTTPYIPTTIKIYRQECQQLYAQHRSDLLRPAAHAAIASLLADHRANLPAFVRSAATYLLRICAGERQVCGYLSQVSLSDLIAIAKKHPHILTQSISYTGIFFPLLHRS